MKGRITRGTCLIALLLVGGCEPDPLTIVSYGGGAYQQSHVDAFVTPFLSARTIDVESVSWSAEYGRLADMVESGVVPWDVVEVPAAHYTRGVADGLFQPLEMTFTDQEFVPILGSPGPQPYGVPNVYWSTVLAYVNTDDWPTEPEDWSDFWDTARFPGARAMYDGPRGNLEFALLADGVSLDGIYPIDVDRAFSKLDEIREAVRVWWTDGTQPVSLLLTGQVAMSSAWSGRIFASDEARNRITMRWSGAAHELDYWVIPVGATHVAEAREFIRFASMPSPMARQAEATAYGPTNALALAAVDQVVAPFLPTTPENLEISFVIGADWWAENERDVTARWVAWKNE